MGGSVMREIKFRAWDKENEEMYDVAMIDVETGEVAYTDHPTGYNADALLEQVELMQYTGLKDKNGKEIFEGDILRDTDSEIYYVDFIRGCFYLRTNYKSFPHLGWAEWLPMCEIDRLANPVDFEIIGNIYENPDLLEV
jgi:uncharacterized phage protein (TIGR01671 family)